MARKDYIDKINKNMEKLTKDELKDVATLTNVQFGVRLKVAEKEYWGKEIANLKSQLQQQALPVVPEDVAKWIECVKGKNNNALALLDDDNMPDDVNEWLFFQRNDDNINLILRAWLDGYTVEKPQLFYIELPNVYGLKNKVSVSKVENGTIVEFSNGKNYALKLTEQEIKSIDERYWQFAVPVEEVE